MTDEQLKQRREYQREWKRKNPPHKLKPQIHQAYYEKNKSKIRRQNYEINIKKRYGIDLIEYDAIFESQNWQCAICRGTDWGHNRTRPAVDHDHQTGKIRGLLCTRCNLVLGFCEDNPEIFLAASDYLKRIR